MIVFLLAIAGLIGYLIPLTALLIVSVSFAVLGLMIWIAFTTDDYSDNANIASFAINFGIYVGMAFGWLGHLIHYLVNR